MIVLGIDPGSRITGYGVIEIEESVQANVIEQRLSDQLLADEAAGAIAIGRAPAFVGCVSNFSNFLDLRRAQLSVAPAPPHCPGASTLYVRATRTSLMRPVLTGGAGQLAPCLPPPCTVRTG